MLHCIVTLIVTVVTVNPVKALFYFNGLYLVSFYCCVVLFLYVLYMVLWHCVVFLIVLSGIALQCIVQFSCHFYVKLTQFHCAKYCFL